MSDTTRHTTPFEDTVNRSAADDLVHGRNGAPFEVLGPHEVSHQGRLGWVIRAFLPGARRAWILPADAGDGASETPDSVEMRRVHAEGLFSGSLTGVSARPVYWIEAEYGDGTHRRLRDPYA